MTRRALAGALGVALMLTIAACGDDQAEPKTVKVPSASGDFEGENYQDVVSDLEDAGFTSVETKVIPDLITGWLTEDGEVESVTVGGETEFDSGAEFAQEAEVVVSYHTFPQDEEDEPTEEASEEPSDEPVDEPSEEPTPSESATPEILTPENNSDLAAMLTIDAPCDGPDFEFAKKYAGQTIAFNGSVVDMAPHGDTRFDLLVGPGNMGPDTVYGPTFQFEDVNMLDMNLTGNVPARFGEGDKARFTAAVGGFNRDSCLFHLEPVETNVG